MTIDKETERVERDDDLRQGDILRLEYPDGQPQVAGLGVVINADCDLAHGKTDGVIAYLPVYTFREYLERFWAPGFINSATSAAALKVLELAKMEPRHEGELCSWLSLAPPTKVAAGLKGLPQVKKGIAHHIDEQIQRLSICLNESESPFERFGRLCRLESDGPKQAKRQILAAKNALGDGHFFISDLVNHDAVGFVIRMRRIYTIDADCCFTSIAMKMTLSDGTRPSGVRFASLTPIYQFKLAQLFALQFSRIGLPDEITNLGELAVDDLVSQVSKVT